MQAVILAAGRSNRFYPFSTLGHKSMVTMLGKPLLQHTLISLSKANIRNIVIVIGKDSKIPKTIQQMNGITITYITQNEPLGMGNALLQAKEYLEDKFYLLAGYHVDIEEFADDMQALQKNSEQIVLLVKEDSHVEKYGVLKVENSIVHSLVEKPIQTSGTQLRVISIYLLNKTFLSTLSNLPTTQYHFEKAIDSYAKSGNVTFLATNKSTITLKHSWDLLTVKDYLLSRIKRNISKNTHIAKSSILEGEIIIEDGATIMEGVCIKGPAYIGQNVMIGNNAIIRNGVVAEENVVIGATMEAKNSFFMNEVTTHTGFIGDSIIGPYSRIAAGFCSANVRFDRKEIETTIRNVKTHTYRTHVGTMIGESVDIGINVSTMPGVCIGNRVTIGPSTAVMENIEDDMLMYTKFQTTIKKKSTQQAEHS